MPEFNTLINAPKILHGIPETNQADYLHYEVAIPYMEKHTRMYSLNGFPWDLINIVRDYVKSAMSVVFPDTEKWKVHIYQDASTLFIFYRNHDGRKHFDEGCEIHESKLLLCKPALSHMIIPNKNTTIDITVPYHQCFSRKYIGWTKKSKPGFRMAFAIVGTRKNTLDLDKFMAISASEQMANKPTINKMIRHIKKDSYWTSNNTPQITYVEFNKGISVTDNVIFGINLNCNKSKTVTKQRHLTANEKNCQISLSILLTTDNNVITAEFCESLIEPIKMTSDSNWHLALCCLDCSCCAWKEKISGTVLQLNYSNTKKK